ncbi:MAG: DUF192 domain-containing protein [archaeon]
MRYKVALVVFIILIILVVFLSFGRPEIYRACFGERCLELEIANNFEERAEGLMNRVSLAEDKGMLFVFEEVGKYAFWMKNTLIPLDIIWLDEEGIVVHIEHAVPCEAEPCRSYVSDADAFYVLETNLGFVEEEGVEVGDFVLFD